jgi:pimeloyl-ACP methyl ester carboxylesterase
VPLACLDFGGDGPAVLLLHGLAGHAAEWSATAAGLTARHRVLALDARGHGRSERHPDDVSRRAHVADVAAVIEALALAPVVLVGQSLGAHTALLVAARRPELVRGLLVAEATPDAGDEAAVAALGRSLRSWPVPFPSRDAAARFFAGRSADPSAWVEGLEHRDGSWWPRFEIEVMERTLREATGRDVWPEWASIRCPTLVVRAGRGIVAPVLAREMVDRLGSARLAEVADAGHDLHLDAPDAWRACLRSFLASLDGGSEMFAGPGRQPRRR